MSKSMVERINPQRFGLLLIFVVGLTILLVSPASGQVEQPGDPSDNEVNAIAKQLYCPVCENIPLDVCPTQACAEWRELIRLKLSEGWDEDQIKVYFAEQYGARVLASPPASGFNWLIYVIPPIAILLGVVVLYFAYKSLRSIEDVPEVEVLIDEVDDEYVAQLEEELRNR